MGRHNQIYCFRIKQKTKKGLREFDIKCGDKQIQQHPHVKYISFTLLRLITSTMLKFIINEKTATCYYSLTLKDSIPSYLEDKLWDDAYLTDNI